MAHHEQNVALLQMVKGCTLRKDASDKLVCNLTTTLLVGTLWITVENSASNFSQFGAFNGYRISKFAAPVSQYDWEQATILFAPKGFIQPFKNLCILYFYFAFRFFKFVFWDFWKWIFKFEEQEWYHKLYNKLHPDKLDCEDDEDDYESNADLLYDTVLAVDNMDGTEFEYFCANLLRVNGYTNVRVTSGSGDQGMDILAEKDNAVWGFQCKRWGVKLI